LFPRKAPALSELETIRIPAEELDLAYNKSADTSYFTGSYRDGELRSVTLTLESGLKLYGTNELFIQMRERPAYYNLMIHKDRTLFNQRYSIYQLADDEKILISYEFTREIKQKERDTFFYLGLAFLLLMGFILIKTLIQRFRDSKRDNRF